MMVDDGVIDNMEVYEYIPIHGYMYICEFSCLNEGTSLCMFMRMKSYSMYTYIFI
jgi:hypothetical protein